MAMMSAAMDEQCDQSSRATAPSCSTTKLQQTSPTAGEPAVSTRVKMASPKSTKKAWRQRLEMDSSLMAASAPLTEGKPLTDDDNGAMAGQLHQSQLFVCRQCGKYFITLKYLEMHSAVHAGQLTTTEPTPATLSLRLQPNPPRPTATLDRATVPSHPPALPSAESFFNSRFPLLLPPTTSTASAPARYRDWTCDICRKKFSQNSSYKNHQRTHSDERPFICTVCSIGFKERYHLKKHTLFKHSNETREQCKICGKRFKDSTAVRAHERIHSDARPYACRRCHKAFKTSECLWHHENRSKSCGGIAQLQLQQVPDTVRSRGRKRGRRYAEILPATQRERGLATSTSCSPLTASATVAVPTVTGSGTTSGGIPSLQIPALPLMSSGLSVARASTSICTVDSITAPLTSSLSGAVTTGRSVLQPPSSSRFDAGVVGRQSARVEQALSAAVTGSSSRRLRADGDELTGSVVLRAQAHGCRRNNFRSRHSAAIVLE